MARAQQTRNIVRLLRQQILPLPQRLQQLQRGFVVACIEQLLCLLKSNSINSLARVHLAVREQAPATTNNNQHTHPTQTPPPNQSTTSTCKKLNNHVFIITSCIPA